jgi:hypothetical protein
MSVDKICRADRSSWSGLVCRDPKMRRRLGVSPALVAPNGPTIETE